MCPTDSIQDPDCFSSSLCWPVLSDQLLLREASVEGIIRSKVNAKCSCPFPALLKASNPGFQALLKTSNPEGKNTEQADYFEIQINTAAVWSVSSHALLFLNVSWIVK